MFRANFQRNGTYQETGIRQLRGLKWKFRPSSDNMSLIPGWNRELAAEDRIVCISNPDGSLNGLDSQTGQQRWTCQLGKEKRIFSPVIEGKTVYIVSRQTGKPIADEFLHAINLITGQQKWQFSLQPLSPSSAFIESPFPFYSPVVAQQVVYIGGSDGKLYAINATTGELIWSFITTKNIPLTSPAIADGLICFCSHDGYLYAIDLTTRQPRWKFEIGALSHFSPSVPAIANGRVYLVTTENILHALDLQTGETLWTFRGDNLPLSYPAISNGIVCVSHGEKLLLALDVETGEPRWRVTREENKFCSGPIIADQTIYMGSRGCLEALDLETGTALWQFETPFSDQWFFEPQMWIFGILNQFEKALLGETHKLDKFSAPIIANEVVYVNCSNVYFYALY